MTLRFQIAGLNCASCVGRAEKAVAAVPGVTGVSVNLATHQATVEGGTAPAIAGALSQAGYPAEPTVLTLQLDNMSCGSCVARVEDALKAMDGVVSADVNLADSSAKVTFLDGPTGEAELKAALRAAGYPAKVRIAATTVDAPQSDLRWRVMVALLLTLPVFVIEMGGHLIPAIHHWVARTIGLQTSWLIQWGLSTAVLFGPGLIFFRRGLPALLRGAPEMNALVALGAGAAWTYSTLVTFAPGLLPAAGRAVYFEAAAVIVTLILVGRLLEERAKGRAGAAIRALVALQPKEARVLRDGTLRDIPIAEIVPGDEIDLRPGERVAVDGIVIGGDSYVDESMLTGEPVPIAKTEGASVSAGTVNGTGALRFQATGVGDATVLSQIIAMVQDAQSAKLPVQDLVNRIAGIFVPVVLVVAALTVALWLAFGPDLSFALVAGVSVLIVACPCAMGLAVPTSIMVGMGRGAQLGVLIRQGAALQRLEKARTIAFDKTGTLTIGKPAVTAIMANGIAEDELLMCAAAVERMSEHPIARAIVTAAQERGLSIPNASDFASVTGHGALANIGSARVAVGSGRYLDSLGVTRPDGQTAAGTEVFVAQDGKFVGQILIADPVKDDAADAVAALHALGLRTVMVSGDASAAAHAVAAQIGITDVVAEVLPGEKVAAVQNLGDGAVFVGDGINDAPALAAADVGIAMGGGTDVAIESADVVLMSGRLRGVLNAVTLARAVMRNIRQNLFWAFAYNVALIPIAAGVLYPFTGTLLSPMFAAAAMALSSVFVLSNALRLRFVLRGKDI